MVSYLNVLFVNRSLKNSRMKFSHFMKGIIYDLKMWKFFNPLRVNMVMIWMKVDYDHYSKFQLHWRSFFFSQQISITKNEQHKGLFEHSLSITFHSKDVYIKLLKLWRKYSENKAFSAVIFYSGVVFWEGKITFLK